MEKDYNMINKIIRIINIVFTFCSRYKLILLCKKNDSDNPETI